MNSRFEHLEFDNREPLGSSASDPDLQPAQRYGQLAQAAFESESFQEALQYFARLLEFDRTSQAAWQGQVQCLIQMEQTSDALSWADSALDELPHSPSLLALKAVALVRNGQIEEALAFSDEAVRRGPDSGESWSARAEILNAQRDAMADYCEDRALSAEPKSWQVAWLLSRGRFFHQHDPTALKLAQVSIERDPTHATPWLQLGRCQERLGLTAQAEKSLDRARTIAPNSTIIADAYRNLKPTKPWTRALAGLKFRRRKP